jgi:hypothetical protein
MAGKKLYRANWSWDSNTEKILRQELIGYSLNFPCGMSRLGNVRADLDPSVKPDVVADLLKPFEHFKRGQFETVLCDPDFAMYYRFGWISHLADLCTKRLIMCTPPIAVRLSPKYWRKSYFITEQSAGHGGMFIRIWQVFDKNELWLKSKALEASL